MPIDADEETPPYYWSRVCEHHDHHKSNNKYIYICFLYFIFHTFYIWLTHIALSTSISIGGMLALTLSQGRMARKMFASYHAMRLFARLSQRLSCEQIYANQHLNSEWCDAGWSKTVGRFLSDYSCIGFQFMSQEEHREWWLKQSCWFIAMSV